MRFEAGHGNESSLEANKYCEGLGRGDDRSASPRGAGLYRAGTERAKVSLAAARPAARAITAGLRLARRLWAILARFLPAGGYAGHAGSTSMETYDICMIVVLVGATIFGAWKGMAWQVASTASLVVSYVVALRFSAQWPTISANRPR